MPTVKALALEAHLKKAAPAPVYALVGADDALRSHSLHLVEAFAAPVEQPGSSVRRFEGTPEPRDVFGELRTVPFLGMAGRRVAVVEDGDAFLKAHAEPLAAYVQKPCRTATLVLCLNKLDMRTATAKAVQAEGVVVDCAPPSWRDAEGWLRNRAREAGLKLTGRAAGALVEAVGPNLLALEAELDKLATYAGAKGSVSEDDVAELVPQGRERSAYDLGTAVARGDAAAALRLCGELLLRGTPKEVILSILARQVRRSWQVGRLVRTRADERTISRQVGMPGFAVRRASEAVRALPDGWFAARLELLAQADYESKTTSLRSGEEEVWLESLLVRLCHSTGSWP